MKEDKTLLMPQPVAQLREKVEEQTRFKKMIYGYDTKMVDEFIKVLNAEIAAAKEAVENECGSLREQLALKEKETAEMMDCLHTAQVTAKAAEKELEQAQKREKALVIKSNRDEELIQKLQASLDSKEIERLKNDLGACKREKNECLAQRMVAQSESEQARKRLKTAMEENRVLALALSTARENLATTCNGVDQNAVALKTLAEVRGAEILTRVQELAEICADYTATGAQLTKQVQQSLCREY